MAELYGDFDDSDDLEVRNDMESKRDCCRKRDDSISITLTIHQNLPVPHFFA